MFNRILLFTICLTFFGEIVARPVSWSGGSTLMYKTNVMKSSYYYHYSPTYKYSIGAEYIDDKHFDDRYLSVRTTYLLEEKETSQRNLYFTASLSTEDIEKFYYGLHGDWETRRIFMLFRILTIIQIIKIIQK